MVEVAYMIQTRCFDMTEYKVRWNKKKIYDFAFNFKSPQSWKNIAKHLLGFRFSYLSKKYRSVHCVNQN